MVSFEPNSQLRQFFLLCRGAGWYPPRRWWWAPLDGLQTASPSGVPLPLQTPAGMAPTSSTAASKSAAAQRANIEMCFKMVSSCFFNLISFRFWFNLPVGKANSKDGS